MSMSKTDFKNAFREVVSSEFAHIPTDENSIDFTFSERFNKRMEKLIRSQKKPYWNIINTTTRRVAVIIVAIFTVFTATFSVKAIREPILEFVKHIYETFTHYSFEGDTTETITKEYIISQLPDGFEQTDKNTSKNSIITTYENSFGEIIKFSQQTTNGHSGLFVDNENTDVVIETINGIEIEFREWYDTKSAVWIYDGYVFEIHCYGDFNFDIIKGIISAIE